MAMDRGQVRVLLIDDDSDDYVLTQDLLTTIPGVNIALEWTADPAAGLRSLIAEEYDACLIDYRLGLTDGLELLRKALGHGCQAPLILLTGQEDRELALQALEAGAVDYLVKGKIDALALERAIRYALQQRHHADELKQKVAERTAELEQSHGALIESEQRLRDADRKKDEFLATLAHELRNPLAPISNALELLQQGDLTTPLRNQALLILRRQVKQMVRLIDDLLDVSRINHGKIKLRRETRPLQGALQQAIETSRPLIDEARHHLTLHIPTDPILVDADEQRLSQIFSNLLNNAAKYTPPGGQITLTAERTSSGVCVSVRDSGVGIPRGSLHQVFELFSQVDRSLEHSQGGLGIGLALVKRLVELHGGTIQVFSAGDGQGSEFTVDLPVVTGVTDPSITEASQAQGKPPGRRILVVDDNPDSVHSLALLLKLHGHEVRTALDGLAAVEEAIRWRPEILFLDLGLPKLNGYEACRRIRETPGGSALYIVAMTGWGQAEDRRKSAAAGFDSHLVKPLDLEAAMEIIHNSRR